MMAKSPSWVGECPSFPYSTEPSPPLNVGVQPSAEMMRLAKKAADRADRLRIRPPSAEQIEEWARLMAEVMTEQDALDQESERILFDNLWMLYE